MITNLCKNIHFKNMCALYVWFMRLFATRAWSIMFCGIFLLRWHAWGFSQECLYSVYASSNYDDKWNFVTLLLSLRFLFSVSLCLPLQVTRLHGTCITLLTSIRVFINVCLNVHCQAIGFNKTFPTLLTCIWFLSSVSSCVSSDYYYYV